MPLLVAMQWLGVDATGQRNVRQKKTCVTDVTNQSQP